MNNNLVYLPPLKPPDGASAETRYAITRVNQMQETRGTLRPAYPTHGEKQRLAKNCGWLVVQRG
jgi:hypothetical protein